jgi:hypothetical protein
LPDEAEERLLCRVLLRLGSGVGGEHTPPEETENATRITTTTAMPWPRWAITISGSDGWYDAVTAATRPTDITWLKKSVKGGPTLVANAP